jgi:hypothetical protein
MSMRDVSRAAGVVLLVILFCLGALLTYAEVRGALAQPYLVLFPLGYSAAVFVILRLLGVWKPRRSDGKRKTIGALMIDILCAAIAFSAMLLVGLIGPRFLPDSVLGATIVVVPGLTFLAVGTYYVAKVLFTR